MKIFYKVTKNFMNVKKKIFQNLTSSNKIIKTINSDKYLKKILNIISINLNKML